MLFSEKLVLDEEKAKVEADIQSCAEEMSTLEQELETVLAAGKQLEMQKTEAQKRLNELDSKVCFPFIDGTDIYYHMHLNTMDDRV